MTSNTSDRTPPDAVCRDTPSAAPGEGDARLCFDLDYREEVKLGTGRRLRLRVPRPYDRERFRQGFEALSPLSRRRRFHMIKKSLSEIELDYLTNPDGIAHYALGAITLGWRGREKTPVGVARFFRMGTELQTAEFAVVVVDAWQNQGIGTLLLHRLLAAARERGIRYLKGQIMADNAPMLHILRDVPETYRRRLPEGVIEIDVPVSVLDARAGEGGVPVTSAP
jgi:GNAT superfamily N-acetyltransferase